MDALQELLPFGVLTDLYLDFVYFHRCHFLDPVLKLQNFFVQVVNECFLFTRKSQGVGRLLLIEQPLFLEVLLKAWKGGSDLPHFLEFINLPSELSLVSLISLDGDVVVAGNVALIKLLTCCDVRWLCLLSRPDDTIVLFDLLIQDG